MAETMKTHGAGTLRATDVGSEVTLAGWVHSYRDHGNLVFIDLRDRTGLTQLVFDPETQKLKWSPLTLPRQSGF